MLRTAALRPRKRRLQRDKDFTGARLSSFREVFLRHGLPGLVLALCFLSDPGLRNVLAGSLAGVSADPPRYAVGFVVILLALSAYTWRIDGRWSSARLGWVLYLGVLSVWEEWVFRLALPQVLEGFGATVWLAAALSALMFGAMHYFTLRWKWHWCVGAGFGGLYFSHQMELHGDLLWVAAIHWIATSINTPRPPSPPQPSAEEAPDSAEAMAAD
nr:CPBP family intramembrane glutamic endopeptidase [Hyphomonas sp. Mor2]